jgi:hypothetical protein
MYNRVLHSQRSSERRNLNTIDPIKMKKFCRKTATPCHTAWLLQGVWLRVVPVVRNVLVNTDVVAFIGCVVVFTVELPVGGIVDIGACVGLDDVEWLGTT